MFLPMTTDGVLHSALLTNIAAWLLAVDAIESAEIRGNAGAKYLTLVNQQCGQSCFLNSKKIGAVGDETFQPEILLLEPATLGQL